MLCLNIDTGHYIEAKHINDVLQMLDLDSFVEEYKELNQRISAHMLYHLPLNDQAITVDTGGVAPNGRLDADQKLTVTIRYKTLESPFDKWLPSETRIGRHHVDCHFDYDRMRRTILIELNKFLPDNQIPGTAATGIKDDTAAIQEFLDKSIPLRYTQTEKENMRKDLLKQAEVVVDNLQLCPEFSSIIKRGFQYLPKSILPSITVTQPSGTLRIEIGEMLRPEDRVIIQNYESEDSRLTRKQGETGAVFYINKKEANVDKNDLPADAGERDGVTVSTFIKKRFKQQLESANLSEQSIEAILGRLFLGQGLKKPEAQSVLICTKGPSVTNVYYSHDGSPVTLTDIEYSRKFEDGEVLSCSTGIDNAFFIIDTSDVKTFQEKMIHRHVGVPKITLNLSNGKSIELPFKKEYIKVTEDAVMIHLDCSVGVSLTNKELNSLTGWALTDLNEVEKSRFFVNGREYTVEEFNEKINPRKQEGAVNPGAGSWADIE